MGGAAVGIDIGSVGMVVNGYHFRSRHGQSFHGSIKGGSLRRIHHDLHAREIHLHAADRVVDVLLSCLGAEFHLVHARSDGEFDVRHIAADLCLDLILQRIGKLESVPVKELDAVEFHRVVGGGDHNSRIHHILSGQVRHCRSGDHAHIDAVGSHAAGTRHQGVCQHITGNSGITSHHDGGLMIL